MERNAVKKPILKQLLSWTYLKMNSLDGESLPESENRYP
ncbi:hypothetical protein LptCag_1656 [Leptospirillum ferriphilum]|uniref:Uncharacterized protein n=1 Tax=Leptospirillum ferriphilum TaxID=178606 RepID=A0A094WAY1_9BACT|nr:hypothetical protein LptCag_1656 [Leptospirillum ferriphilum]